jgi:hypothetical protein
VWLVVVVCIHCDNNLNMDEVDVFGFLLKCRA